MFSHHVTSLRGCNVLQCTLILDNITGQTIMRQLALPFEEPIRREEDNYIERLTSVLGGDLDFQNGDKGHSSHRLHSFPAKFPPQLPQKFIRELTRAGDKVLDPMMGSGTTIV